MGSLSRLLGRFRGDRRGNIAVIFAIACVPVLSGVGCAIDYSMATRMKAKLQSSADAASVASISQKSAGYIAASTMTTDGSVTAGVTDANAVFDGNMNTISGYQNLTRTSTVTKTGIKLRSVVTYSAQVPTTFLGVMGYSTLTVGGSSSSSASLPPYLDFYLMLDVSGSMGLPSTAGEESRLAALNPDNYADYQTGSQPGCTLACHFAPQGSCTAPTNPPKANQYQGGYDTNGYCLGYLISRVSQTDYANLLTALSPQPAPHTPHLYRNPTTLVYQKLPTSIVSGLPNSLTAPVSSGGAGLTAVQTCPTAGTDACIQLRLDAVGYAVNQLFATANTSAIVTNQFRVGLYPYIKSLYSSYFPLTSSINGSPSTPGTINYAAANLASLLDTNTNANLGSGGTDQDAALIAMNNLIVSVGDGSASNKTLPYVFIVTDGAVTPQTKGVPNGGWSGSNHDTVIPSPDQNCTNLKSRGITVSILYIPFQPISPPNPGFAGDEDDYANNNIPSIPASLQACASPGFYYTANTPADITAALNAMFNHALITAHITN
jgi:Flp pilus assembly protein TadG